MFLVNHSIYTIYSNPCVPGCSDECCGKTWDGSSGREKEWWRRSQGGTTSRPYVPRFPRGLGCPRSCSIGCRTLTGNIWLFSFSVLCSFGSLKFITQDSLLDFPSIFKTLQLSIFLQRKTGQLAGVWAGKASPVVSSWLQSVSTRSALSP